MYTQLSRDTLPSGWIIHRFNDDQVHCIQLKQQHIGTPVMLFHLLTIHNDLTWKLHTASHSVSLESPVLCQQPSHLTPDSAQSLIALIDSSSICIGNSQQKFIELARKRKGQFFGANGELVALEEDNYRRRKMCNDQQQKDCLLLLLSSDMCSVCDKYRNTLRAMLCRQNKKSLLWSPHPKMNKRFFRTLQRRRYFQSLRKTLDDPDNDEYVKGQFKKIF